MSKLEIKVLDQNTIFLNTSLEVLQDKKLELMRLKNKYSNVLANKLIEEEIELCAEFIDRIKPIIKMNNEMVEILKG
jgi:hypothetical protein